MDTRRLILAMTLSFIVMYAWILYNQKYLRPKTPATQPVAQAPATQQAAPPQAAVSATQLAEAMQPLWRVIGAPAARTVTVGEDDPAGTYNLQAFLTSRGAAVERILVVEKKGQKTRGGKPVYAYAAKVDVEEPYPVIEPLVLPDGRQECSWQTASIRIGTPETTVGLAEMVWNVEAARLENGEWEARFWVDVLRGEQPVVRIIKRFTLAPKSFAMNMDLTLQPPGQQDVSAVVDQLGAAGIRREDPRSDYRKIFVVANDNGKPKTETPYVHADLVKSGPKEIGSAVPIWWTALVDKYFAAVTAPTKAVGGPRPVAVAKVFTYTKDTQSPDAGGDIAVQLVSPPLTATAAAPAQLQYDLYVGPKSASIFDNSPTYVARSYSILRSAEYTRCTFSWLGEALTWFLHLLYSCIWPHNYGLAIIILVLLVRAILHPLTKYQQVSMSQMQARNAAIQPKIAAVKQKYPNDRQKQQAEMMRVYREAGINPASQVAGCLPMVIQLPLWVALWSALNYDINLWHEPFALWIRDLSAPDALFSWSTPINIPLVSFLIGPVNKFNLLPILLAVAMYLQQKFTPKPPPAPGTPPEQVAQQQQMQKVMGFMMIFFGVMFYNMPSGLNLYIMASSAFGVLEQQRIRKHMEDLRNRPQTAEPRKRHPWMDKLMDLMEKRAAGSHTIRKDKDS